MAALHADPAHLVEADKVGLVVHDCFKTFLRKLCRAQIQLDASMFLFICHHAGLRYTCRGDRSDVTTGFFTGMKGNACHLVVRG